MTYIKQGYGFTIAQDFSRARTDTPITLAPEEHAKAGHVIGYIQGDPAHPHGFMRSKLVRVHVQTAALGDYEEPAA